jgi:hypothetical protein
MPTESNQINRSPDDLSSLPKFNEEEVVYRWHKDWWDGPINGSILYKDCRYWFNFYCDTDEPGNPYYYQVYPLNNDEANDADAWSVERERFRTEWMPLANNPATKNLPVTKDLAARWKSHEIQLPDFSGRQPVGWFMSGSNGSFHGIKMHKEPSS